MNGVTITAAVLDRQKPFGYTLAMLAYGVLPFTRPMNTHQTSARSTWTVVGHSRVFTERRVVCDYPRGLVNCFWRWIFPTPRPLPVAPGSQPFNR